MSLASLTQIAIIESKVEKTSLTYEEKEVVYFRLQDEELTEHEAQLIIEYLEENYLSDDPRDQFNKFQF